MWKRNLSIRGDFPSCCLIPGNCRAHSEHVNIWFPVNPLKIPEDFLLFVKNGCRRIRWKVPGTWRRPRWDSAVMFILLWRISVQYNLEWLESYSENMESFCIHRFIWSTVQTLRFNITDRCSGVASLSHHLKSTSDQRDERKEKIADFLCCVSLTIKKKTKKNLYIYI